MIRVQIVEPGFSQTNAFRGIGMYTELLSKHLVQIDNVSLVSEHPDIVHHPFFDLFFHTLPLRHDCPVVVTIHDVIPLVFPFAYRPGVKGALRFLLQKHALSQVSAICTDSYCSKRDIVSYLDVDPAKVHVTLLAGNPEVERQSVSVINKVLQKYGIMQPYVLYVGDMNYNKNLPRFVRACAGLPALMRVVLVGRALGNRDIPEGKALQAAIEDSGMVERVHTLTTIPKSPVEDLAALFSGAAVYVQPSLYEGFGLSVLDALQCGTPVVSSNASSLPEVAGAAAIYADPTSEESLLSAMKKVLMRPAVQKKQLEIVMETQHRRFSWAHTARETTAVYREVLNRE